MSSGSYFWAWGIYLLASVGLLFTIWRVSSRWSPWGTYPARALLAALVLVPVSVSVDHSELAPAWLVWLFDMFMQEDMSGWRSARPILVFGGVAVLAGVFAAWREQRRRAALENLEATADG